MQSLAEGKNWRCRMWAEKGPEIIKASIGVLEETISAGNKTRQYLKEAALELFVDRGEHWYYALLHAHFTPSDCESLRIRVDISQNKDEPLYDTIAPKWEKVHQGLPRDFAAAVMKSACKKCEELGVSGGMLLFDTGAHGSISSSEIAFSVVTGMLISLVVYPFKDINQQELQSFIAGQDFFFHKGKS